MLIIFKHISLSNPNREKNQGHHSVISGSCSRDSQGLLRLDTVGGHGEGKKVGPHSRRT